MVKYYKLSFQINELDTAQPKKSSYIGFSDFSFHENKCLPTFYFRNFPQK